MSLVARPDCGTGVSFRAPACPKCGAPRAVPVQPRKTHIETKLAA